LMYHGDIVGMAKATLVAIAFAIAVTAAVCD
jgi:hypothetical protein